MDKVLIDELIKKIENSSLTCFEYEDDDFKIRLEKNNAPVYAAVPQASAAAVPAQSAGGAAKDEKPSGNIIKSPIVGTFYQSSSPEERAYVNVGDNVAKGDTVCVIEAMKLFNEIVSEYSGRVSKILVNDGDMVEYDQPLMIIE